MKLWRPFVRTVALVLVLGAGACLDQPTSPEPVTEPELGILDGRRGLPRTIRVYTQNMFLGGETSPLFTLPFGDLSDPDPVVRQQALGAIIEATNVFYGDVLASDIPARAAEIVTEIQWRRPQVVALQEAVGYATGHLSPAFDFTPTAAGPDLLGTVLAEIAARGLPYSLAVMQPTTSIALPLGPPGGDGNFPALGVQDRVAMLVHDDLKDYEVGSGIYGARIPIGAPEDPTVEIVRAWARVTVDRPGKALHFVGTHLETQGSGPGDPIRQIHNLQAAELQAEVLADLDGDVILMGDLNSDAAADPSAPSWTPTYGSLVDAGFIDVWERAPRSRWAEGFTCCQEPGRTLDERIDFVLFRPEASHPGRGHRGGDDDDGDDGWDDDDGDDEWFHGRRRGFFRAVVIGDRPRDQTASGQWPSNHAGIVASIRRLPVWH